MTKTKSKRSANTNTEESGMLHKMHKKKEIVKSDIDGSKFEAHASTFQLRPTKAEHVIRSSKKEKKHKKKKTTVDEFYSECAVTVSHKLHAKITKGNEKVSLNDEPCVMKLVSSNNTDENVHSAATSQPCQETSHSSVKRKHGKKQKRPHDELVTEQSVDTDVAERSVKKKKVRHSVVKDTTSGVNTEQSGSAATKSSQYHALEYLHRWKSSRDSWTFQKVRQVWLLQHMYDPAMVTYYLFLSFWL